MANMKTLTVNGVTYTIDDPDAVSYGAQQELTEEQKRQARENINAVSPEQLDAAVKDTVDKTCPSFSESGTMVTCEPVEGCPLTVTVTPEDKNYLGDFDYQYWDGKLHILALTPGQYRIWGEVAEDADASAYLALMKSTDGGESWQIHGLVYDVDPSSLREIPFTVTGNVNEKWAIENKDGMFYYERLEINRIASQITRCGKNWLPYPYSTGGNTTNLGITITDHGDGSLTFNGTATGSFYHFLRNDFTEATLPAGRYCISTAGRSTMSIQIEGQKDGTFAKSIKYGDGSFLVDYSAYDTVRIFLHCASGKTVNETIYPQLERGSTATAYEPSNVQTFAIGDAVPALAGVNTIYADAGLVTVTGRADPVPIIKDLQTRLAAIEAAIVSNI